MENHFGKGLMAGLQASYADTAAHAANFCADYKRGFVLGYSHRMFEKTGDRQLSAWEAGILTRRYGLDRDMVMDFFKEGGSGMAMRYFLAGYRLESKQPEAVASGGSERYAWRLSSVWVSKSRASWRSCSCSLSGPLVRLTMRPRLTAGRLPTSCAQRSTFL